MEKETRSASNIRSNWWIWLIVAVSLLCLALVVPPWQVTATMQPDLACWLYGAAIIVFIKGVVEIVMLGKIYKQNHG